MDKKYQQTFTNGSHDSTQRIAIIGAGLVGSLAAIHFGKKGHEIDVFEYRDDIRNSDLVQGRSINLALSARGRRSLAAVGLEESLLSHGIPMKGRMLHDLNGGMTFVPYDSNSNQCIYSVGRKHLNEVLLNEAEKYPNIHLNFNKKLVGAKLSQKSLTFYDKRKNETIDKSADLIIGADGAFSAVRRHMLQLPGFNFSQTYIEHGYLELCIPSKDGEFQMPTNYLHIWPRGKFMMIALPNQDRTWTVTLFMPFTNFDNIKNPDDLLSFFGEYFPDAVDLIGAKRLVTDFFRATPQHLVSIKARPYFIDPGVLIIGDAAHAMVPFYGQGMNAGFEDCALLSDLLNCHHYDVQKALREFSETRWEDAHAICDLAMYNYVEMRDLVTRRSYRLRKKIDDFLFWLLPNAWIPLYNSVSFSHMPYKKCIENRKWQDTVFLRLSILSGVTILLSTTYAFARYFLR